MSNTKFNSQIFSKYQYYLYTKFGIKISYRKREVLRSKVDKLKLFYKIADYEVFLDTLKKNEGTAFWHDFVHEITTHKTDFFREINHFNFLKENMGKTIINIPSISLRNEIRIWSAGCSTGEEPYTIAMLMNEIKPELYVRILATDISKETLQTAMKGTYSPSIKKNISPYYLSKYFLRDGINFSIKDEIKNKVVFRQFNLIDLFPFKRKFDIIFCRNVMIYFSDNIIEDLLNKFYKTLVENGLLFIGHSESLISKKHTFKYIQPTIYKK